MQIITNDFTQRKQTVVKYGNRRIIDGTKKTDSEPSSEVGDAL